MDEKRAGFILDEHLEYLDGLQEKGIADWFGWTTLQDMFGELTVWQAKEVLRYWKQTRTSG